MTDLDLARADRLAQRWGFPGARWIALLWVACGGKGGEND